MGKNEKGKNIAWILQTSSLPVSKYLPLREIKGFKYAARYEIMFF